MKYKYYYDELKNKKVLLLLLSVVILGFLLRLYHLGGPSLWYDELMTAGRIDHSLPETIKRLFPSSSPPLYYIIMNRWVNIFGNSEFSLRFPSLLFSVLSIIFIFKLSKELFDEKVGLFSALFLSISPYSIYYAQEAKMYSMLWFFGTLSFLFFHKFTEDNKIGSLLSYAIFTAVSIYTMYIGFIFIIIQNILFFSFFNAKRLKKWLLGQLIIILLYLPWLDEFLYTAANRTGIGWIPKVDSYFMVLIELFPSIIVGAIRDKSLIEFSIYCFLIISAIINLTNIKRKKYVISFNRNDYMLFIWITAPIVVYWLINTLVCPMLSERTIRYIGFIHIPLIVLISKGINKYNIRFKSILLIFLLVMTFSCRLYPLYQYSYRKLYNDDSRSFSHQLHKRANSNSLILTKLPFCVVNYYNRGYKIKSLKKYIKILEKKSVDRNFDSIFIVYRFKKSINKELLQKKIKGYKLKEDYYTFPYGFLWFKRL